MTDDDKPGAFIRAEVRADRAAISQVVGEAFGRPHEARLVELVRASDRFVPGLSLVASLGDDLVGHALFSYVDLLADDGVARVLELAPLAVRPGHQGEGIGSALVREGFRVAGEMGEPLVLVLGDPEYYKRLGFEPASQLGIVPPEGVEAEHFMAVVLSPDKARNLRGLVSWPAAYTVV